MDNNSNFEQQFTQNVKASAAPQPAAYEPYSTTAHTSSHKFFLITTIALAAITFVETIALIITLVNFFSYVNGDNYEDDILIEDVEGYTEENFTYDADYNVVAMNVTCTNDNGASYVLSLDGKYQSLDASKNLSSFGTYTITNSSLVSLTASDGANKVLYYDGSDLADGLDLYSCIAPGEATE